MQPAVAEVVQYLTLPASTATAGDFFAAIRSLPWCAPPERGAPKSRVYVTCPITGKISRGTFVVAAGAAADTAARPTSAARKRIPRGFVRWRLIGDRGAPVRVRRVGG